jgi:predicted membrane protein
MEQLCAPALIYLIFSITQILIDMFSGLYNTAFMKTIVMIMITFLLQILCRSGLNIVSWIIVFIPFILMTVIVTILLYYFGLNPSTGRITGSDYKTKNENVKIQTVKIDHDGIRRDSDGNIVIFDPYYNPVKYPVYYKSPNIVIPKPVDFPKYNN